MIEHGTQPVIYLMTINPKYANANAVCSLSTSMHSIDGLNMYLFGCLEHSDTHKVRTFSLRTYSPALPTH